MAKLDGSDLVIGGCGFIGANLCRELAGQGRETIALDNEFLGRKSNLDGAKCKVVVGDASDEELLEKIITENNVKRIYHLGGYTASTMFTQGKLRYIDNLKLFCVILELARKHDVEVVYASTSAFYARCKKPFKEDMVIRPGTEYELSKYCMEQQAHMYNLLYGMKVNGCRFFSVYGPFEKTKGRFANMISQFYWSMKNGVPPVIFGDGAQTRDFTYVGDLVQAIAMIMDKGKGSEVYNIGASHEYTLNELVKVMNKEMNTSVKPKYIPVPWKNYVKDNLADISKIRKDIGWEPKTTLSEGIQKIIKHGDSISFQETLGLYEGIPVEWDYAKKDWK
ncbi:MAG TPA: NAD-dependent epimerase/dehydratase family protein [archaeon]|nr:NAD-dependent epimerase/dehydratase family protein [archaeon]